LFGTVRKPRRAPAVVVVDDGRAAGVVMKLDLLEYLAHKAR
jgi:hypothetical protein